MSTKPMKNTTSPFLTAIEKLPTEGPIPFCMPGHKRNPQFDYLRGNEVYDITEMAGYDDLHHADGIIAAEQAYASTLYGTVATRFLVGGSTAGILAGIHALTHEGDTVIMSRCCHKSVYHGVALSHTTPVYLPVRYVEGTSIVAPPTAQEVEACLQQNPAALVVITSPTYEGLIGPVSAIAEVCHRYGAKLLVDEAHGAHLGFGGFPHSARTQGADIVVQSLHKTLPSLTQTAILHALSPIDIPRLDAFLSVFQTSSPSYVLLSSIVGCIHYLAQQDALQGWYESVMKWRQACRLQHLSLFAPWQPFDPSKLVVLAPGAGVALAERLRREFHIEVEMTSVDYIIAMTGAGDTPSTLAALYSALRQIDADIRLDNVFMPTVRPSLPPMVHTPSRMASVAICSKQERLPLDRSVDRISCDYVWVYPPGSPIIVPGERITDSVIDTLAALSHSGLNVYSALGGFPDTLVSVGD